jgi:hypothetical protein
MKTNETPKYNDELQKKLEQLVAELATLDTQQEKIYRGVLVLAITSELPLEELKARLALARLPGSTANEMLRIYSCLDLARLCAVGDLSVREALRQARGRLKNQAVKTTEETRLLDAADRVLDHFQKDKGWRVKGKIWDLEFTPVALSKKS